MAPGTCTPTNARVETAGALPGGTGGLQAGVAPAPVGKMEAGGSRRGRHGGVPAGDVATLAVEDEGGGTAVTTPVVDDESGRRVEDLPRRPLAGDSDGQRELLERSRRAVNSVQRGHVHAVVGH